MKKIVIVLVIILLVIGIFYVSNRNIIKDTKDSNEISKNQELYEIKCFNRNETNFYFEDEMDFLNTIYYKVITDYQEYSKFKDNFNEIIDMKNEDFEDYFLVLTVTENESTKNLGLESIEADETTLYIGLDKEEPNDDNKGISIKIDKTLYRENIDVFKTIKNTDFMINYSDIRKISRDYSIKNAISDNCFVISNKEPALNVELFEKFLKDFEEKKESEIRIYSQLENDRFVIYDLKYSSLDDMYYVCIDNSRMETSHFDGTYSFDNTYNYYEFDIMEEKFYDENSSIKPLYESTRLFTFNSSKNPENSFEFGYFSEY